MKKKRLFLLIALLVCIAALATAAVSWASGTEPTVVFDAAAKTFSFRNCQAYTYGDEDGDGFVESYPDLFRDLKDVMPGDRFTQKIRVKVTNAGADTVKMYLRSENPNQDYETLLSAGAHPATLDATFSDDGYAERDILELAKDFIRGKRDETVTYTDTNLLYLGAFTGSVGERSITVDLSVPEEAGNELAGLDAQIDWVFVAEIIPYKPPVRPDFPDVPDPPEHPDEWGLTPEMWDAILKPRAQEWPAEQWEEYALRQGWEWPWKGWSPKELADAVDWEYPYERTGSRVDARGVWDVQMMPDHVAYIIGRDDGLIHPMDSITRAEAVTIFFRLMTDACRSYYWSSSNTYYDVSYAAWYNHAISTATEAGIIEGYPNGSFGPMRAVTRAEFVTMVSRIARARYRIKSSFTDIDDSHWAMEAVDNAVSLGIINGYPDGTFRPDDPITRAEAIAICNRLLGRYPCSESLLPGMKEWPDNMDPELWYYLDVQEATVSHTYTLGGDHVMYEDYEYWTELIDDVDWAILEKPDARPVNMYQSNQPNLKAD